MVSQILQVLLKALLKNFSAHLNSTAQPVERLENTTADHLKGMISVSFDVVSLYTNVDTEEAIKTTLEYVIKYKPHCFSLNTGDIWVLLHTLLDNDIFVYEEVGCFKQIRGLAMGKRLSGTLAILVMDKFERMFVYQELSPTPRIYVRYLDDVGTVVRDREQANNMLEYLNSKHPTIKFEMELPSEDDGFLPILDMAVQIDEKGHFQRRLFTKAANKGIVLNFNSHQPTLVKKAMVQNEIKRAKVTATAEYKEDSFNRMATKLQNNGYPKHWIVRDQPQQRRSVQPNEHKTLRLPFISDQFNHGVKQLLKKHEIPARLVNHRGTTLSDLTKRRQPTGPTCKSKLCPAPTICQRSHVVYLATFFFCELFGSNYVGMTERQLHACALEHS